MTIPVGEYNVTPFPFFMEPLTQVTPLSYRDGMTYAKLVEGLRIYLNSFIVPEFNSKMDKIIAEFQEGIANAEAHVTLTKTEWQELFDAFMANVEAEIAVLNDSAVSGLIGNPESVTGVTVRDLIRKDFWVNVMHFGAVGDGVADDSAALQNAANFAYTLSPNATLYMPAKTFLINSTVSVRTNLMAFEATLNYPGTGTALILGNNVAGSITSRKVFKCPNVVHTASTKFDGTSIGILAINLNACDLTTPFIQEFEKGLVCKGLGGGFAYTNIFPQSLWGNHRNLSLEQDDTGWCNSNTFTGGRFAQSSAAVVVDDVNYVHVYGVAPVSAVSDDPNNNTFIGCSFEADNRTYYRAVMAGYANAFVNCRWEGIGGSTPRILWKDGSSTNRIIGGYDANKIVETYEGTFTYGPSSIMDGTRLYGKAANVSAQVIPNNAATTLNGWSTFIASKVTHDAALGEFKPRWGRWNIRASVAFNGQVAPAGYIQAILYKGSAIIDIKRINPGTQINSITLAGTEQFNGTETFKVVVTQTSGADLALTSTAGFTQISAEYIPN